MNWPTHTDYQDAIQNPEVCFAEADLKLGVPACDMLGLPRVTSGNFASVYELAASGARWAIRCFVRQVSGQQGRYARLSQHLSGLQLESIVRFEFILKGILVRGEWYPIVKMEWVDGLPLNLFLERRIEEKETLKKLAQDWRTLLASLRKHKLAHGDLQHGNVMVTTKGELRLVDYDGMFAPVFGRGKSPELGHANFQHPRRTPDFYGERLDDFSALVIYTTFLALAEDASLFQQFYTADNLLFSASDYKAPLQSPVFQKLKQNANPMVGQLTTLIEKCCMVPAENVPDFQVVLAASDNGTLDQIIQKVGANATTAASDLSYLNTPVETAKAATRSSYDHVPVATPTQSHVFPKKGGTTPSTSQRKTESGTQFYQQPQPAASEVPPYWKWAAMALAGLLVFTLVLIYLDRAASGDKGGPDEGDPAETNAVPAEVSPDTKAN